MSAPTDEAPVVLFDGVCNLCNGAVQFILDHDRTKVLRFASLQSDRGQALLRAHGIPIPEGDPESIVLIQDGHAYERSTAALQIAAHLTAPWSWIRICLVVPRFVRDLVYKLIAKNRYRVFGKTNECRVPTPELRTRMIG